MVSPHICVELSPTFVSATPVAGLCHVQDVLRGVCEGQVHLQLVLDRGVVRAYLTPDSFTVPRSEWVQLMLTCDQRKVCCASCSLQ